MKCSDCNAEMISLKHSPKGSLICPICKKQYIPEQTVSSGKAVRGKRNRLLIVIPLVIVLAAVLILVFLPKKDPDPQGSASQGSVSQDSALQANTAPAEADGSGETVQETDPVNDLDPAAGTQDSAGQNHGFTVHFDCGNGTDALDYTPQDQVVEFQGSVSRPPFPTRDGYVFGDWYENPEMNHPYDFSSPVKQDLTLYASWLPVGSPEAELSEEEITVFLNDYSRMADLIRPYVDEDGFAVSEEDGRKALDALEEYTRDLLACGDITYCSRSEGCIYMEFASTLLCCYSPSLREDSSGGGNVTITTVEPFLRAGSSTQRRDTWAPYASEGGRMIGETLYPNDYSIDSIQGEKVTRDRLPGISGNTSILLWDGHGCYIPEIGPVLALPETRYAYSGVLKNLFSDKGTKEYIWSLDTFVDLPEMEDLQLLGGTVFNIYRPHVCITPLFVKKHIRLKEHAFVYLSACQSGRDDRLARAFVNNGADCVVYNRGSDNIKTWYTERMMQEILAFMSGTAKTDPGYMSTVGEALSKAHALRPEEYKGYSGTCFAEDHGVITVYNCYPDIYRDSDYTFVTGLQGKITSSDGSVDFSKLTVRITGEETRTLTNLRKEEYFHCLDLTEGYYFVEFRYDGHLLQVPETDKRIWNVEDHRIVNLGTVDLSNYPMQTFTVIDRDKEPVGDVSIEIWNGANNYQVKKSEEEGRYIARVPDGVCQVKITAPEYEPVEATIRINGNGERTYVLYETEPGKCTTSDAEIRIGPSKTSAKLYETHGYQREFKAIDQTEGLDGKIWYYVRSTDEREEEVEGYICGDQLVLYGEDFREYSGINQSRGETDPELQNIIWKGDMVPAVRADRKFETGDRVVFNPGDRDRIWHVLSDDGEKIKLFLDDKLEYYTPEGDRSYAFWNVKGGNNNNDSGPIELLTEYAEMTSGWVNVDPINFTYINNPQRNKMFGYTKLVIENGKATITATQSNNTYTVDGPLRARPITVEEIMDITGDVVWKAGIEKFTIKKKYAWLYQTGCWTLTTTFSDHGRVWVVATDGRVLLEESRRGGIIRPVILTGRREEITLVHDGLLHNGLVSGKVTEGDTGIPAGGAVVSIQNQADRSVIYTVFTDENGGYSFDHIPSGMYTLNVSKKGYYSPEPVEFQLGIGAMEVHADDLNIVLVPAGTLDFDTCKEYLGRLSCSTYHVTAVTDRGNVLIKGNESKLRISGQNVPGWSDMAAVVAGDSFTVGLKRDGTVVKNGEISPSELNDFNTWTDIVAIDACTNGRIVGLKSDGTVRASLSQVSPDIRDIETWRDIVEIAAGNSFIAGLKSDGTVCVLGSNNNVGYANTWTGIIHIAAGKDKIYGLKTDGTVIFGKNGSVYKENVAWIDAYENYVIFVYTDGSVRNDYCSYQGNDAVYASCGDHAVYVLLRSGKVIGIETKYWYDEEGWNLSD